MMYQVRKTEYKIHQQTIILSEFRAQQSSTMEDDQIYNENNMSLIKLFEKLNIKFSINQQSAKYKMSEFTGQQSCSTMDGQIYNENNMLLIRLKIEGKCQIPLPGSTNQRHPKMP